MGTIDKAMANTMLESPLEPITSETSRWPAFDVLQRDLAETTAKAAEYKTEMERMCAQVELVAQALVIAHKCAIAHMLAVNRGLREEGERGSGNVSQVIRELEKVVATQTFTCGVGIALKESVL